MDPDNPEARAGLMALAKPGRAPAPAKSSDAQAMTRERKKLHDYADALKIPEIHLTAMLEDLSSLSD